MRAVISRPASTGKKKIKKKSRHNSSGTAVASSGQRSSDVRKALPVVFLFFFVGWPSTDFPSVVRSA